MRPLTSGRSVTPWRDFKLPTACVSSVSFMISTLADSTVGGRCGPPAPLPVPPPAVPAAGGVPAAVVVPAVDELASVLAALPVTVDDTCVNAPAGALFWYHQAAPEAAAIPMTAKIE